MNRYYTAIAGRANHRCEYCQALACRSCNLRKGTRISGIMLASNTEVSFFHPRQDKWSENFQVDTQSGKIIGITSSGKVTIEYLGAIRCLVNHGNQSVHN
ncbi:MAG: hypothetical protein ACYT04_55965 [Nostoc sp.]